MQSSFIESANTSTTPFPLNNLPYGIFSTTETSPSVCVAIGDHILDLQALADKFPALFPGPNLPSTDALQAFSQPTLNQFLTLGRPAWQEVRSILQDCLSANPRNPVLKQAPADLRNALLPSQSSVKFHLPVQVGDYTDFYSSLSHARNVGTMFRGPENALPPNWLHMPIGYHGRASSVVVSGTPVVRPCGQLKPNADEGPKFGACRLLDFELEMATVVGGKENKLGQRVKVEEAEERVFGFMLMNDWSARDIQKWEYVPLGPFGAKNFATTVSPWVVCLEALEPFRVELQQQHEGVLEYLKTDGKVYGGFDVDLQVGVRGEGDKEVSVVCRSNLKHLYWSVAQQIAHHTVTGCNLRAGDLLASGTISGDEESSFGSMLELSWKGTKKIMLEKCVGENKTRTFLQDGDTAVMTGYAKGDGYCIGFGECTGKILPAVL